MKKLRKIGLKDVALDANVSLSTASHAINGSAPLTTEVRDRVLASAARLGYLQALHAKGAIAALRVIVVAVPSDAAPQNDLNFVSWTVLSGLRSECENRGIRLIPLVSESKFLDVEQIGRIARDAKANGVIALNDDRPELIRRLHSLGVPVVLLNGEDPSMTIDTVTGENRFGARKGVEHLLTLGHRRILHVTWKGRTTIARRYDGYADAFFNWGLLPDRELIIEAEGYEPGHGEKALDEYIGVHPDLNGATAIFCAADNLALGCLNTLARLEKHVPKDVSVMGFDDIVPAGFSRPPLSTVRVPVEKLGAAAIALLEQRIVSNDPSRPAHRLELGCSLILRDSIREIP